MREGVSIDAGMSLIAGRMQDAAQGGPGLAVDASVGLEVQIGRLAAALERQQRHDQFLAQSVAPVDIPPLDFSVTAGHPKLKAHRASASDQSPQEGFVWFVQRLSLAGLNAGDLVNLYRTASQVTAQNMNAIHLFTGPANVTAGNGVADWEPGSMGLIMRPDDSFWIASAGTLAATEIILSGQAIQVAVPFLAEYLL